MIFLAFLLLGVPSEAQRPSFPSLDPLLASSAEYSRFNFFDMELLDSFDDKQNYFISPASIKATLAMVLEGARGSCALEIIRALRITDSNINRERIGSILYDFNSKKGTTVVESANGAFISQLYRVVPEYERTLRTHYKAEVRTIDFSQNDYAARLINGWVSEKTRGLITDIISPANFNSDATIVLVNALYFQGKWKNEFDEGSTSIKCFYSKNRCINTRMMQIVENFSYKYIERLDAEAISLPYGDGQYSMLVVLPSKQQSVDFLIRDMKFMTVESIVNMLEPTEVFVNLPSFEIEYSADMVSDLERLGIKEIFGPTANLSGIIQKGQIKINHIVHKAKIEVNEKGTTAAGATGVIVIPLMGTSMPRFVADRPFLFFIYHTATKNILFEGRLNEVKEVYNTIFTTPSQPQQNKQTKLQPAPLSLDKRPINHQNPGQRRPNPESFRPQQTSAQVPESNHRVAPEQASRFHVGSHNKPQTNQPIYFGTDTVIEARAAAYSSGYFGDQNGRQPYAQ
uniref:Serpin domain-containing protein n=1 Tax=Photinus pyralis TaxID=7054 RepID=A0A1Y1L261_PHOPY